MEKIDFSPLQGTVNDLAISLAILLGVPLIVGLVAKWVLTIIKIPYKISNYIAVAAFLYVFYLMFNKVLG